MPERVRALGFHDFRWLFVANVISVTGGFMQLAGVNWIVTDVTDSGAKVSFVAVASLVPFLLFSPLGGALCDRFERRLVMLVVNLLMAVLAAAMAVCYEFGWLTYWPLFGFALAGGVMGGITAPVQQAIVGDLVDPASLRSAAVLNSTSFTVARAAGPAAAGLMIETWGAGTTFWANAVSFAAVIIAMNRASRRPAPDPTATPAFWSEFRAGVRYTKQVPGLRVAMGMCALMSISGGPFQTPFTALVARRAFDTDAGGFGLLQGAFGAGSLVAAIALLAFDRGFSHRALSLAGSMSLGFGAVVLGLAPTLATGLLAMGVVGVGFMLTTSTLISSMQSLTVDAYRGRVLSIWMMVFSAVVPATVVALSSLADVVSIHSIVVGAGVATLVLCALLARGMGHLDDAALTGAAEPDAQDPAGRS